MSSKDPFSEFSSLAKSIMDQLDKFDATAMKAALTHSHQIVSRVKREATGSEKTDAVTWEVAHLDSQTDKMETLFKTDAYNKTEGRIGFISVYNELLKSQGIPDKISTAEVKVDDGK